PMPAGDPLGVRGPTSAARLHADRRVDRPSLCFPFSLARRPPSSPLFPYTTLFRSHASPRCRFQHLGPGGRPYLLHCVRRGNGGRSEEHTSELQSRVDLVCRLLLEKRDRRGPTRPARPAVTASPRTLPTPLAGRGSP